MKALLTFTRWLERVEGFFLSASLIALLLLTLYAVAYRNLVAPVVLKMQTATMDETVTLPEPVPAPAAEAPRSAPAPTAEPAGGAFLGDLEGEVEVQTPPPAPAANAFLGDLADDEPTPPAPAANAFLGDLEGEIEAPAAVPEAAPTAVPSEPAPVVVVEEPPLLRILKAFNFGWIDVVTRHLLLWVAFFGAAVAAGKRKHIKIDALSRLLPARWRDRLLIALDVVALVVCVFLARAAWHFMQSESEGSGMLYGPIPGWVGIVIIPVGFGLLAWHFLFEAVAGTASALGYRSQEIDARRAEQQAGGEA